MSFLTRSNSYARFVKLEHTVFSLPLLFAGALLPYGTWPPLRVSGLILLAGTGARTAAFALNRIIDRHIDAANPRTSIRELPQGHLSLREGKAVGLLGAFIYIASAAALGPLCLALTPIPLILFTVYPFLKRWTVFAHAGVGLSLAMAPLGGWIAIQRHGVALGAAVFLGLFTWAWVAGFDIIYATLDEEFDRGAGLHSLPAVLGRKKALQISAVLHGLAFVFLVGLWWYYLRTALAFVVLLTIGILLYYEQRKASDVELAFFKVNAIIGFAVLVLVVAGYISPL